MSVWLSFLCFAEIPATINIQHAGFKKILNTFLIFLNFSPVFLLENDMSGCDLSNQTSLHNHHCLNFSFRNAQSLVQILACTLCCKRGMLNFISHEW